MIVRPRRDGDLPPLVRILERIHLAVGYPVRRSNVRAGWLAEPDALGAWVAELDGTPVGHVALHPAHGLPVPLWCAATGCDEAGLAVVSRLFSDAPGAGTALLTAAVDAARAADRAPVLEVSLRSAAVGFYLSGGWTVAGEVDQVWGETQVRVAAMVLPGG